MSRRKTQFLRTLRQAGGSTERILPRDVPRNVRDNLATYLKAVSLAPTDDTLTRWLRWQFEAEQARKGRRS